MSNNLDFDIQDRGNIFVFDPNTSEAREWLQFDLQSGTPWGDGFIVEKVEGENILKTLESKGFSFEIHDKKDLYNK